MRLSVPLGLLCAALLAATPAPAQDRQPEPEASPDVVVTGQRPREEQVRDFVKALTPPSSTGSIPRFIDEVCPVAVGLAPAPGERVAARLREVARAIGLPVAGAKCQPNAFVIVTRDKRAFIETLAARKATSFGVMTHQQIRRLARSKGPAAAWHLTGPVDESGAPLLYDEYMGAYRNDSISGASRIRTSGGRGFDATAVVVETGALEGLTATQLADYAAMRLFAKVNPARLPTPGPRTILTVLEAPMGTPVPVTLTEWDLGFLRGLYGSSTGLYVNAQRSEIVREVSKTVGATED
jgi:hypothetical protein